MRKPELFVPWWLGNRVPYQKPDGYLTAALGAEALFLQEPSIRLKGSEICRTWRTFCKEPVCPPAYFSVIHTGSHSRIHGCPRTLDFKEGTPHRIEATVFQERESCCNIRDWSSKFSESPEA